MAPSLRGVLTAAASLFALAHAQTIAITGAGPGNVQTRLEIRDLEKNADQWNLYMLAMADFKKGDQADPLSYYGVASVHGVPNEPYDGAVSQAGPNGYAVGYCPHLSNQFPPWHRAYVTLFEQNFMTHVKNIANQFQGADHDRYAQAASVMRIPYFDWALAVPSGQPALPASITNPSVTVNSPSGQQTIANPLLDYNMHPLNSSGMMWSPWNEWQTTIRHPNSNAPDATSNQQSAISTINGDNSNLRNRVYNLFTTCTDFRGFGNSDQSAAQYCSDSLESIHNNVHNDMGGLGSQNVAGGHMTILPLASFDPVFWLHHANVDRIFAMWQGANPDSYTMDATNPQPTYFYPANSHTDANTFLAPFHKDSNGGQHTGTTMRDWKQLGYTYPEFLGDKTSAADIRQKINTLYNPQNPSTQSTPVDGTDSKQPVSSSQVSSSQVSSSQTATASQAPATSQSQPAVSSQQSAARGGNPFRGQGNLPGMGFGSGGNNGNAGGNSMAQRINDEVQDRIQDAFHHGHKRGVMGNVASAVSAVETPAVSAVAPIKSFIDKPVASSIMKVPSLVNSTLNATGSALNNMTNTIGNMTQGLGNLTQALNGTLHNATSVEYSTQIACQPYSLNGSFNVYVFLGKPESENPSSWATDKNLCGTHAAFSSPDMYHDSVLTGTVPLTQSILKKVASGLLPSAAKEAVLPFIRDNIQWRVQSLFGHDVPAGSVPGLQVGIGSAHVQPATAPNEFPKLSSPWTQHTDVTQGKAGGLQHGDKTPFGGIVDKTPTAPTAPYKNGTAPYSYNNGTAPSAPSAPAPSGTAPAGTAPASWNVPAAPSAPSAPSSAPSASANAAPATGAPSAVVFVLAGLSAVLLL